MAKELELDTVLQIVLASLQKYARDTTHDTRYRLYEHDDDEDDDEYCKWLIANPEDGLGSLLHQLVGLPLEEEWHHDGYQS